MIDNDLFQKIFDEIDKYLPSEWNQLVAYFEYGEESYSFEFYVKVNDTFIKCYDLPNVSEDDLFVSFKAIDELIVPQRTDDQKWTNMTMVVDSEGNMHTDFDYTDLSDCAYQYKKDWKSKYLK